MVLSNHFISDGYAPPTPPNRYSLPLIERARIAQREIGVNKNIHFVAAGTLYTGFKPSLHFETGLVDDCVFTDLSKSKRVLSVGVGPASFERLLVQFGIPVSNICLADRKKYSPLMQEHGTSIPIPAEFEFVEFDMLKHWPAFRRSFDYVFFPQSFDPGISSTPMFADSPSLYYGRDTSVGKVRQRLFSLRREDPAIHMNFTRLASIGLYDLVKEAVPQWLLEIECAAISNALKAATARGQVRFSGTQTPYHRLCYYLYQLRELYDQAECYEFLTIIQK